MVDGPLTPEDTTRGVTMPTIPAHVRDWIYGVLLALAPLAVAYGYLDEQEVVLWLGVAGAVFGLGTATVYRPGKQAADAEQEG